MCANIVTKCATVHCNDLRWMVLRRGSRTGGGITAKVCSERDRGEILGSTLMGEKAGGEPWKRDLALRCC
eukprot:7176986-Pyramimonas_sp.AAC.1